MEKVPKLPNFKPPQKPLHFPVTNIPEYYLWAIKFPFSSRDVSVNQVIEQRFVII